MATPITACPALEVQARRLREVCTATYLSAPRESARRTLAKGCVETAKLAGGSVAIRGCAFAETVLRRAVGIAGRLGLRVAGVMATADVEGPRALPAPAGIGFPCLDGLCGARRKRRRGRHR